MAALANWLWRWLVGGDVSPERFRWQAPEEKRVLLHVGCGRANRSHLPCAFQAPEWHEVRVDLDREVEPDLVASVTDLSAVPDGAADAYYASHVIEHLYWFEVPQALAEARRVLKPNGFAVITCPDLQEAAAMIAEDRLYDVAYYSPVGPITPFDIVFSYRPFVERWPLTMSHKCGFTLTTLVAALREAGFVACYGMRRPQAFDLWVVATSAPLSESELTELARTYLPEPLGAKAVAVGK